MHSWTTLSHVLAKIIAKLFESELRNDEVQQLIYYTIATMHVERVRMFAQKAQLNTLRPRIAYVRTLPVIERLALFKVP